MFWTPHVWYTVEYLQHENIFTDHSLMTPMENSF